MTTETEQPEVELKTARVTMVWPPSVKAAVQERVGARGLSQFTLDAVLEKLSRPPEPELESDTESSEPTPEDLKPMALTKQKPEKKAKPNAALAARGDLFQRISKEIPGGLVPASQILKPEVVEPEPTEDSERPTTQSTQTGASGVAHQREVPAPVQPAPVETTPAEAVKPVVENCGVCGNQLENGACWNCF